MDNRAVVNKITHTWSPRGWAQSRVASRFGHEPVVTYEAVALASLEAAEISALEYPTPE